MSYCKFWIYWVGVDAKFKSQIVIFFIYMFKFKIYNMTHSSLKSSLSLSSM